MEETCVPQFGTTEPGTEVSAKLVSLGELFTVSARLKQALEVILPLHGGISATSTTKTKMHNLELQVVGL
jgi:ABC-type enterobactin transport system permease subunit